MKCASMLLCLALGAIVAEAMVLKENRPISPALLRKKESISPALHPESSKEFLKDLSGDKRPKVDILHFNHPYPVVQDSEDFDKDFIKDQNTDNGEWKAQSEYDRLRHRVAELKKKAAAALEKKDEEKKELETAMKKHDIDLAKDEEDIGRKSKEVAEPLKPVEPTQPVAPLKKTVKVEKKEEAKVAKEVKAEASWWPSLSWPFSWPAAQKKQEPTKPAKTTKAPESVTDAPTTAKPKAKHVAGPKPTLAPIDLKAAQQAVEQAKNNLKGCEKELSVAKAQLKKLVDDLENAKMQQVEAKEKLNNAKNKQAEAEKKGEKLQSEYSAESKEYEEAKAEYDKQKALVENLRAQLLGAAKKVEALRAAEDKDGGVYPTPRERSAAVSTSASQLLAVVVAVVATRMV